MRTNKQPGNQGNDPSPCLGGITTRFSGSLAALTQFLDAADLAQLSCVCRQDHYATDQFWDTCAQLFRPSYPWSEGTVTLQSVLRGTETSSSHPQCYSYAERQALCLVRTFLKALPSASKGRHVIFGTDHPDDQQMFSGIDVKRFLANPPFEISSWFCGEEPLGDVMRAMHHTMHVQAVQCMDAATCSRFLLMYLLATGPLFTFTWSTDLAMEEQVAALWFGLGIAPRLPVEPPVPYEDNPRAPVTCDSCMYRYRTCIDYKYES